MFFDDETDGGRLVMGSERIKAKEILTLYGASNAQKEAILPHSADGEEMKRRSHYIVLIHESLKILLRDDISRRDFMLKPGKGDLFKKRPPLL
ncbi:hypothetical protein P7F88_10740 [Vibrio hannami]|uniref:hypothetical protein n=1 Tax=Vibrio hannami TaxID=2717094 RepID=UPI00240F764E|nr:hypothetical protein [Vibrio hannami]MDG3086566.1 hypothetical protein [Vibrio hannami]